MRTRFQGIIHHKVVFPRARYRIQNVFLNLKASQKECTECGDKIFGTYYTIDDKIVCEEDYKVKIKRFPSSTYIFCFRKV